MTEAGELLKSANEKLLGAGVDSPLTDCYVLLSKACNSEVLFLKAHPEYEIIESEKNKFLSMIDLRCEGMPVAYLTNNKEFYSLDFYVDVGVLIPRPDTECVLEEALKRAEEIKKDDPHALEVLDMCCGSGCIGIAFVLNFDNCKVSLSDISEDCIEVTQKNIDKHSLSERAEVILSDLFDNINGDYDIIVSNPPYVTSDEMTVLQREVRREPEIALYGGCDGLSLYRSIIIDSVNYLNALNGCLVLETGINQAGEVKKLMQKAGYEDIRVTCDLAGIERCVSGRIKK